MKKRVRLKYKTELDVKQALGIDSFRNLSKAKVMQFAAMMPDMDKEVALKIVEQFPEFKAFALDAVAAIQAVQEKSLEGNKESQARVHQAWSEVREILKGQLSEPDLTWEQKKEILDLIMETARLESAKDSENKQFLKDLAKYAMLGIGGALLTAIVFVGGRFGAEQLASEDDDDEA